MNLKALVRASLPALVALGVAACIIGPKQDDPASDLTGPSDDAASVDTGTMGGAFDTDGASDAIATPSDTGASGDVGTGADTATEDGCAPDASDAGDASEAGCATSDASSDGADVLGGD